MKFIKATDNSGITTVCNMDNVQSFYIIEGNKVRLYLLDYSVDVTVSDAALDYLKSIESEAL